MYHSSALQSAILPFVDVFEGGITAQMRDPLGSRWTENRDIRHSIAIKVALNWNVTWQTPEFRHHDAWIIARRYHPRQGRWAVNCEISQAVTIVILRGLKSGSRSFLEKVSPWTIRTGRS